MAYKPEISSIFNRFDFLGVILPGYVAVILSIVLFRPDLLSIANKESTFDLFSAVVFLVAGPTVGATLQIFHRYLYSIYSLIRKQWYKKREVEGSNDTQNLVKNRVDLLKVYYSVRLSCNADEKSELDKVESIYDFSISTAIALLLIGLSFLIYKKGFDILTVPIFVLCAILFLGGYFERKEGYWPIIEELLRKKFP
jgi:hypothetical protein